MKAFGVRLAAGIVTILTGAIMAAQSQKEKLAATESAWTEESVPPAKTVMPVGLSDLDANDDQSKSAEPSKSLVAGLLKAAPLKAADSSEASSLRQFSAAMPSISDGDSSGEHNAASESADSSVRLVQHTDAAAGDTGEHSASSGPSMALPGGTLGAAPIHSSGAGSASGPSMQLPGFDDMPPMDANFDEDEAGFAGDVAMTNQGAVQNPNAPRMLGTPKMSSVQFADTASPAAAPQAEQARARQSLAEQPYAGPTQFGNEPVNDLRSGDAMNAGTGFDAAGGPAMMGSPSMHQDAAMYGDVSYGDDSAYANNSDLDPMDTPGLADTADPSSGSPSSMLAPVLPGMDNDAARLAAAPSSTIRINRDPVAQTQVGNNVDRAAAATIGFASSPKIVGADGSESAPYAQTGGQFEIPSDAGLPPMPNQSMQSQPASDYGVAGAGQSFGGQGGYGLPDQSMQSQAAQNLSVPNMRMGNAQTAPIGGTPMPTDLYGNQGSGQSLQPVSPSMNAQPLPRLPNNTAMNDSVYQPAGFKRQPAGADAPIGSTLASPGERSLDGPQAPSVIIEKRAPQEVKVGKPASFVITVRNVGNAKALNVQVFDRVPTGTVLTDATPRPSPQYQPELYWELGDLEAGQERTITLQLTPQEEGELGSVARVAFQAAASVRTVSTRPELKIVQKALEEVLIGQQLEIELEVSNPGSGAATGVLLQEDVPEGLVHPAGKQLDNLIGTLRPGEVRRQILRMKAVKPGVIQNTIRVKGDDGLETSHSIAVNVISPDLQLTLAGPSRRYLERQATYELRIDNVGTAAAENVDLSLQLDRGFTFVKTNFEGQYDPTRHAVFWSLEKLPAGEWGKVEVTLLPVEEGNRVLHSEARADLGVTTSAESQVVVDSLAELTFSIADTADPIEVGGVTTYEIRVSNTGSKDDNNVNVALQLPQGMTLVEQGDYTAQGNGVITFSPRGLLKANDEVVYRVKAQGVAPGRHLVKAIVTSDQSNVPVTKEESIMVYADQ
ncbi:DUF11 domain-containing protein [Rhodopirellula sp. MGV]|uniref:DUF11 domain-containing protein n=1 Tax=Rhodopirellula sp. MGV TaxID=2023130 RepID=UPI000B974EAD|nr:DUF11 domain-containing protein [Rhodopirellula sp. MGV]OYP34574.1 hypothetical protein CGZ80_14385 [Rhodopirellula sp. MGV]PNY36711.1 DUF11 domain-containing protein [Rhodopirellula baltica]